MKKIISIILLAIIISACSNKNDHQNCKDQFTGQNMCDKKNNGQGESNGG